jgi:hypothetical protein
MTPRQAADFIGCTPQQVRTLIRLGRIKAKRTANKDYRGNPIEGSYTYLINMQEVERYKEIPRSGGYPRGRKRPSRTKD